jgi:putative ATPase
METTPLAERMRPANLDDFFGQEHIVGANKPLRRSIEQGMVPSMILWGPPGVGKTTLAGIISETVKRPFFKLSAISSGVKDVREAIEKAAKFRLMGQAGPILFIDEIHRFSKSQQDALLAAVEKGTVVLIGATTENPSFEVNAALLSRCEVYVLRSLEQDDLKKVVNHAIEKDDLMRKLQVEVVEWEALLSISGGDARKMLNALELAALHNDGVPRILDNDKIRQTVQEKLAMFDKSGEMHYDIISALIKSIRGSDPNAALYYLARMLEGGEKPEFIARRLLILASEDVGNANPTAFVMANNCFQAVHVIGLPESDIILSQTVIYLATSPKSNSAYTAIKEARRKVKETGDLPVPLFLRNAQTALMRNMGYGKDYAYSHDFPNNFIQQEFMPDGLEGTAFFTPGRNAREEETRTFLRKRWKDKYGY